MAPFTVVTMADGLQAFHSKMANARQIYGKSKKEVQEKLKVALYE